MSFLTDIGARLYTYDIVILTADRVGRACATTSDADYGDGRAVQAEQDVQVGQDDAKQAEKRGTGEGVRLKSSRVSIAG